MLCVLRVVIVRVVRVRGVREVRVRGVRVRRRGLVAAPRVPRARAARPLHGALALQHLRQLQGTTRPATQVHCNVLTHRWQGNLQLLILYELCTGFQDCEVLL